MNLRVFNGNYHIHRFSIDQNIPTEVFESEFYSISRSKDELSIVCDQVLAAPKVEKNWVLLQVLGPLDFSLTGILASLANPLAEAKISIFAISSFDTDYLLLKQDQLEAAKKVLLDAKFHFAT